MRQSIWERDVEFPSFPKLEGDIKTDVLVIGGGLCGEGLPVIQRQRLPLSTG